MEDKLICFNEDEIIQPREAIIELMDLMVTKGFTDYSGGNIALRVGSRVYITQSHSADRYRWKLKPDNIIVTDINKNVLEGRQEKISREGDLHYGVLQRFPDINCTLHGNSFYSPLLVSLGIDVVAVNEVAHYYQIKRIPVVPEHIKNLSEEENETIFSYLEELKKKGEGMAVIMPYHGIFVCGRDHNEAFALFDAVETNSRFIMYREMLKKASDGEKKALVKSSEPCHYQEGTILNTKVITAEDIMELKNKKVSQINLRSDCIVTSVAESTARELGIRIFRKQ